MAVLTQGYELSMFFSSEEAGWSEKLLLKADTQDRAMTAAVELVNWRRHMLPFNMEIVYARVTSIVDLRIASAVGESFPLVGDFGFVTEPDPGDEPTPPVDPTIYVVNTTRDAVVLRMESATWAWSNRYVHGIPDPRVNNDRLVNALEIAAADPGALVQYSAVDWSTRFGQYLWHVKDKAYLMTRGVGVGGARTIIGSDIARLTVRKSGGRKVGSPFGASRGRAVPR